MEQKDDILDLLVVGAGPTGIALGARAREAGLAVLLVERGALTQHLLDFPRYMNFFTTRDRLEIPEVPFTSPRDKPHLQETLIYYREVVDHYRIPMALHETVLEATRDDEGFCITTSTGDGERSRRARAMAIATGFFGNPKRLGVPGEDRSWVHSRYVDPYRHHGERVVLVGGGNSACEAALELWRNGAAQTTMVVRGSELRDSVKYWVKPDVENRIAEGSIDALLESEVEEFGEHSLTVRTPEGRQEVAADAAYVLIGYDIDADLLRSCGVEVDPETSVPAFDEDSCETNVPGLYVAGAVQSGRNTNRIFIDNSREHGARIVHHLLAERLAGTETEAARN